MALFIWSMLAIYMAGRVSQLFADRLPALWIVVLHVVPSALLALAHGSALYRLRGMAVFTALCLGFGTLAESVGLRTGFPFGRYHFTDVMGPKVFDLPLLLALAYLGIGYAAWVLALLILGYERAPLRGVRVLVLPLLASFIMLAWDLTMEADWSTVDRAWIWHDGGPFFGAPVSNFAGWFGTAYLYYQSFALYCRSQAETATRVGSGLWLPAIVLYAVCGLGNLLILGLPMAPAVVADATGRQWLTADILRCCALMSVFLMCPLALAAWARSRYSGRGWKSSSA